MIWFFLAGMVAGAIGMLMYAHWWMGKHGTKNKTEEQTHE